MHFTCDLILAKADGRHFEQYLSIWPPTISEAAVIANCHVADRDNIMRIEELSLQVMSDEMSQWVEANQSHGRAGVCFCLEPREIVTTTRSRPLAWLKSLLKLVK